MKRTWPLRARLGACCLLWAACGGRGAQKQTNVLLITFDTTRVDALSCYGGPAGVSPVVDRLAREGVLFEQAHTPIPLTLPAHSSLMTGRYPHQHGVLNNNTYRLPGEEVCLAEVLSESGYDTAAFVGAYVLAETYGLDQGFEHYDASFPEDSSTSTFAERPADEVADAALAWLAKRSGARPFFLWLHFYDPHYPHEQPAGETAELGELYHREVNYCDTQLGRILQALRDSGERERTLVVFTSDHGEGRGEKGESTHGFFLYEGTQHIPLVIQHPALEPGSRRDELVSLLDVMPTILGLLDLEGPSVSGRDLFEGEPQPGRRLLLATDLPRIDFSLSPLRAVLEGRFKYIRAPHPEVYDLIEDPRERRNLAGAQGPRIEEWNRWMDAMIPTSRPTGAEFEPDADSTRRIMGLGYAGGGESRADIQSDWEPRQLARWINLRNAGLENFFAGRREESMSAMRTLLSECESSYSGHLYLGLALTEKGDFEGGLQHLRRAVELQPKSSADAYWNLAVCKHQLGHVDEELPDLLAAIDVDPGHLRARQKLAEHYLRAEKVDQAREHLLALRKMAPDTPQGVWAQKILAKMKRAGRAPKSGGR